MFKLSLKSFLFYKGKYLLLFLGLTFSVAILSGALTVGSSVRQSLHDLAFRRLGKTTTIVDAQLNPVKEKFAELLAQNHHIAPILSLYGTVSVENERINNVAVYGVTERFQLFFENFPAIQNDVAYINENLAKKLKLSDGSEIVLRVKNNSLLPGDIPLAGSSNEHSALRIAVKILPKESLANHFSLYASQLPSDIIYLQLNHLQNNSNMIGYINLILTQSKSEDLTAGVNKFWQPEFSGLSLTKCDSGSAWSLISTRVFLPSEIIKKSSGNKVLTYMANEIRFQNKVIPYSIVSAIDKSENGGNSLRNIPHLAENEIAVNEWVANELGIKPGDKISLKYFVDNTDGKLAEQEETFVLKEIIKTTALDRDLMPSYPGIADEEHCRDWEPGIPMDLSKIRPVDEKYWSEFKGTPKALVSYSKGVKIWGNRFGNTTSLRWDSAVTPESIVGELKSAGTNAAGLMVRDVKAEAFKAAEQGIDFGALFLSMSFFIIMAVLILAALFLSFHLEMRKIEIGVLKSCGFSKNKIYQTFLMEGFILSSLALIPGLPLGIFYTAKILDFLGSIWQDAVGTSEIKLHIFPEVIAIGAVSYLFISMGTIFFILRKYIKKPTVELLARNVAGQVMKKGDFIYLKCGLVLTALAIIIVLLGKDLQFAISSFLLLISGLLLSHGILEKMRIGKVAQLISVKGFAIRSLSRNSSRSLGAIFLMSIGIFLVLNTVARQKILIFDEQDKNSGTGGFYYFAESSIPLRYQPDSKEGVMEYGFDEELLQKGKVVSFRHHRGDDASCLNLNRAQQPQIFGVTPSKLVGHFNLTAEKWELLNSKFADGAIPALGDENTVLWGLGLYKGVGSEIFIKNERGENVKVRIVALLKNSILQGALLINQQNFNNLYPAESGYKMFLVEANKENVEAVKANWYLNLEDFGITLHESGARLRNFLKIEATYLIIFQILGGFGLIIGAFGFGFITIKNVQERQSELAILKAIGFQRNIIFKMLFQEQIFLLFWAVICGVLTALISWIPLFVTNAELPLWRIVTILCGIVVVGIVSSYLCSRQAVKLNFTEILRNE